MWEVTYTITPDRGYFDSGERALAAAGVHLESIQSIDFVLDDTVVIVYEVSGSVEAVERALAGNAEKVVDYEVTDRGDALVAQIRFRPDEWLERLLSLHRSFGVTAAFPIPYVDYDPPAVEVTEVGPQDQLRRRIEETRELATVDVRTLQRHEPGTRRLFAELTDRQREVLRAAVDCGYYRNPREATHADIAAALDCSTSVVGQHLRRIEQHLVSAVVPEQADGGFSEAEPPSE